MGFNHISVPYAAVECTEREGARVFYCTQFYRALTYAFLFVASCAHIPYY